MISMLRSCPLPHAVFISTTPMNTDYVHSRCWICSTLRCIQFSDMGKGIMIVSKVNKLRIHFDLRINTSKTPKHVEKIKEDLNK